MLLLVCESYVSFSEFFLKKVVRCTQAHLEAVFIRTANKRMYEEPNDSE